MKGERKPSNGGRAALYARVSSDTQTQEGTIASQLALLRERIEADGYVVEPELCFVDDGVSGSTLVRPALERLRDQAAAGAIDRLYILSPDRLARRHAYQMVLMDEWQAGGVEVVFLNHPLGSSPEDQLLLQVQGMIGEYERAKILERTRRGRLHAARCGSVSVLGHAPFGYRYVDKHAAGGVAAFEIVEEEAQLVRQIFAWVGRDGCSLSEIARRLQQQQVPPRRGGPCWRRSSIWKILTNPAYRGMAVYGKTRSGEWRPTLRPRRGVAEMPKRLGSRYPQPESEHIPIPVPALVDDGLFADVQERMEENRRRLRASRRGACYLLQGLVLCDCCGYAFYGQSRGYYRCLGRDPSRFGGQAVCDNRSQRVSDLDAAVWNDVCDLLSEPERLREEFERRQQNPTLANTNAEAERLRAVIGKTKRGISRLLDVYTEELIDRKDFETRMRRLQGRLAKLEASLQTVTVQMQQAQELRVVFSEFQEFADQMKTGLTEADWSQRRAVLRALVKRVEVGKEKIRIVYKVPPRPFANGPEGGRVRDCPRRVANLAQGGLGAGDSGTDIGMS